MKWLVDIIVALIAALFPCLLMGCAQNTEAPIDQFTGQETLTPTTTDQEAATQGSQVYVWVVNAPGRGGLPDTSDLLLGPEDGVKSRIQNLTNQDGTALAGTDAGYAQAGINITITTGGTTPSLTGTTTATASAAQTPSAYPTLTPTQDIKPEASVAVPIGVAMPGGMVDQQATATGKGQTSGTTKTSENELRWAELRTALEDTAKTDVIDKLLSFLGGTPTDASTNGTGD